MKEYHVREIMHAIRRNAQVVRPEDVNNPDQRIVIFKNGVLHLDEPDRLHPHSSDYRYTLGIPHDHNPTATCPEFDLEQSTLKGLPILNSNAA